MDKCQCNTEQTVSRRVNLVDCVVLREADRIKIKNSWSGPSSLNMRRSDGEPITGEPSPRVMTSSLGWGTPPRMARTSARDARADPEVTTFPEVGGYDNSHEIKISDLMLSEQPEVTVTETGEASSNPRREKCSRIKQSYLDKFKTAKIVTTKIVNIVISKIFNWGRSSVGSTIGCPSVTRKGVTSVTYKCHCNCSNTLS